MYVGHHSDPCAASHLLEPLEGVPQCVLRLGVDGDDERSKSRGERLLDLGKCRFWSDQLTFENDLELRRQLAGVEDGRRFSRAGDAREKHDGVRPRKES